MSLGTAASSMLTGLKKNDVAVMFSAFTNKYVLHPLTKTEFTAHLIQSTASRIITAGLIYMGILLAIYEIGLHTGVALGLWNNPAYEVFKEIPVHCAHVYVSINMLKQDEEIEEKDNSSRYLLKYPVVYHFEFSPEEYAHEEFGTDLKFIKSKVHQWFSTSELYHHHKDEIKEPITINDLTFYNKNRKILKGDDEYLCDLDIGTGDTIFCVIRY